MCIIVYSFIIIICVLYVEGSHLRGMAEAITCSEPTRWSRESQQHTLVTTTGTRDHDI